MRRRRGLELIAALLGLGAVWVSGAEPEEIPPDELERIRERLDALEKKAGDVPAPERKTPAEGQPVSTHYDEGFWLVAPDDRLRVGGKMQFDFRVFEDGHPGDNTFQIRRARLYATGVLEDHWGYMVMGRWDRGDPQLHFAWLESQHVPEFRVRVGQFKQPVNLEGVNGDDYLDFNERSIWVSNLLQLEDIGAMVHGKLWDRRIEYGAGIFNGRGKNTSDTNDDKEVAAQVTLAPFRSAEPSWIKGMNVSLSGSHGTAGNDLANTGYSSSVQTRFWTWAPNVTPNGSRDRVCAELEWLIGPGAIRGGANRQTYEDLRRGAREDGDLDIDGWFLSGSWLLTGEEKPRNRALAPREPFRPDQGTWGAWEVAARYEQFHAEREFLKSGYWVGTSRVDAWVVGLNWYINRHISARLNFQETRFHDPIVLNDRPIFHEHVLTFRIQCAF